MSNSLDDKNQLVGDKKSSLPKRPKTEDAKGTPPGKWKRKNIWFLVGMILASVFLVQLLDPQNQVEQKTYSEFRRLISDTSYAITSVKITRIGEGYELVGERKLSPQEQVQKRELRSVFQGQATRFKTLLPDIDGPLQKTLDNLEARGVKVEFIKDSHWFSFLSTIFPLLLLVAFFWFMMARQGQMGGPRGIFNFGKVKPRGTDDNKPKVTFRDVAGCDEAKQELREIVDFLRDPGKFSKLGGRIPKGVLLLGPPGTGKTLLAKAVSGEADVPFFSMSGSDFVEMFVGVGASRVRDLFEQGKKNAPCIIFIDEIDAVGRHRGAGLGGGHDEREQTLNELLVEMDGFSGNDGVILIAATNRPDVLHPALLRPGRFDRQVVVDLPDGKGREGILRVHLNKRKIPLADDVDVSEIAKGTPGLAGADLENLVNEACLLAARFGNEKVSMLDFEEAKDKVMIGSERFSRILGEEERRTTAYHEAGHAIVSLNVEHADPLHKITIIPRGRALGITFQLPEKEKYTVDSRYVLDKIAILMGGRGAELLVFNQMNTGASNDIEKATELARKYVCEWGMSELGPISYGKKQEEIFLGREIAQHRDYSEATAIEIDRVVRRIVDGQMTRVSKLLADNREKLVNLSEALLEHEVLEADEIRKAIAGEMLQGGSKKSRAYIQGHAENAEPSIVPAEDPAPPPVSLIQMLPRSWRVRDRLLGGDRPLLMGILNVTPDSFFDDGKYTTVDAALRRCEQLISEGADIIDVGGESTRPGAQAVSETDEKARVVPVIEAIARRFDVPVSIDTMKSSVARASLDAGACILNDVSAMTADPLMLEVPQGFGAGVVLNHMRGNPGTMQRNPSYQNVVAEVRDFLLDRIRLLASLGLSKDHIAVDPGVGFGKRLEDNYSLIERLEEFDILGCPVMLGHSRKSFIGKTAGLENSDRLQPSVAIAVYAVLKGASILRVHDVKATFEALRMVEAIQKSGLSPEEP